MIKVIKNKKQVMEKTIKEWAINMVRAYTWLTIKFEYSKKFGVILIDFVYHSNTATMKTSIAMLSPLMTECVKYTVITHPYSQIMKNCLNCQIKPRLYV